MAISILNVQAKYNDTHLYEVNFGSISLMFKLKNASSLFGLNKEYINVSFFRIQSRKRNWIINTNKHIEMYKIALLYHKLENIGSVSTRNPMQARGRNMNM